ncbi:MAG: hypothetical protein SGARI_001002, partial [Bacillariaceae sp.]
MFIQANHGICETRVANKTDILWAHAKSRWEKFSADTKKLNPMIVINLSIGTKLEMDKPYQPSKFYTERGDDDDSTFSPMEREMVATDVPAPLLFSQTSGNMRELPVIQGKQSLSKTRHEQNTNPTKIDQWLWRNQIDPASPLFHSMTKEHYLDLKDYFMKDRSDGMTCYDKWLCRDGEPLTWPEINDMPDHIRSNPQRFHGKLIERDKYPVVNPAVRGSYLSFEKTEEEKELDRQELRKKSFETLVTALGR